MLKLNASYSKKVPVPGEHMTMESYLACVEVELPGDIHGQDLQQRIHETFELVRRSVEDELSSACPPDAAPERGRRETGSAQVPASPKQIRFLSDMAMRGGMDLRQLAQRANQSFGVADLTALTRRQASQFIDELKQLAKAA